MKLCYVHPNQEKGPYTVTAIKAFDSNSEVSLAWLHSMMDQNPDLIFFFVVDSTDIW